MPMLSVHCLPFLYNYRYIYRESLSDSRINRFGMEYNDDKEKDLKPEEGGKTVPPSQDEGKDTVPPGKDDSHDRKDEKKSIYDQYRYWGGNGSGGKGPLSGPKRNRLALIAFVIILLSFAYIFMSAPSAGQTIETSYSAFKSALSGGEVLTVDIVEQNTVNYTLFNGTGYTCRIPYFDSSLMTELAASGVEVSGSVQPTPFWYILIQFLPWIIFIVMIVMIMRQTGASGGNRMMSSFGKSHAQMYGKNDKKVTFQDVAGQREAKFELQEVVDFLKHPDKFTKIGAKIPRGVLLVGPPGTGKTLIARAVAGEAGVSFLHTSGSDFVEMFVGMGAARVRDLFAEARKNAPCIIFIDELDAVGRARGAGLGGGHDEREQTLNQMLVEMDGFAQDQGVIVMAATNRPDVLDPALLRPGRFDRQVVVALPDVQERLAILKIHAAKIRLSDDVELDRVARATPGSSGADLANLVNEAALFAARSNRQVVDMDDFEKARDKILLGVARTSVYMTDEEKKATAYHEAGHTLLHYYLKNTDPLHKVTIIPHGRALGLTMSLPEKDAYTKNKSYLMDRIKICMGGYVAEDLIYGETTTGTSNDIKQASDMARRMVTEWGMSDLGFISLGDDDEPLFLGREIAKHKNFSEETMRRIDEEVSKILTACMDDVRNILSLHRDQLDRLTQALVEKETLDDREIRQMFGFPEVQHASDLR